MIGARLERSLECRRREEEILLLFQAYSDKGHRAEYSARREREGAKAAISVLVELRIRPAVTG